MNITNVDDLDSEYSSIPYDRISIHLPASDDGEKNAAIFFIGLISKNYPSYSYTQIDRPVYVGKWRAAKNIHTDEISILFVDVKRDSDKLYRSKQIADWFYETASNCYDNFKRKQLSFWIYIEEIVIRSKDNKKTADRKAKARRDLGRC